MHETLEKIDSQVVYKIRTPSQNRFMMRNDISTVNPVIMSQSVAVKYNAARKEKDT